MFPINSNDPYINDDGSRTKIGDAIGSGGGGSQYTLPTASTDTKGGVKIGTGLTMDGEVLNNDNPTPYVLPTASTSVKGGVQIGDGLTMDGDVLNSNAKITKLWEWDGETTQVADTQIILSSDDYDFLIVNAIYDTQSNNRKCETNQVMLKGHGTTLFIGWQAWESQQTALHLATRTIEYIDNTHYKLSNGYQNGDFALAATVTVIYGVKL